MSVNELAGSPVESLSESSGSTAERQFLEPMSSRLTFAQSLVGTAYPNFPQSRIVAVDLQPFSEDLIASNNITAADLATIDYGEQPCLITAKYGPDYTKKDWPIEMPKPSFRSGTELRYQIKGGAKFLTVPVSGMKWEDDDDDDIPVPESVGAAVQIVTRSIQIQWDFVDNPPITLLDGLSGKVCDSPFLGCPAETLLFEGYDIAESFRASPINPHTNRVTVQLTYRRVNDGSGSVIGWNHDYREEPAAWQRILLSNGDPRYIPASFGSMFT